MLEVLKSRYITGLSAPCKKARPFAAPMAIFNLVPHGNETDNPINQEFNYKVNPDLDKRKPNDINQTILF